MGTCKIQYNGSIISELEETGDVVIKYNDIPIRTLSGSATGTLTEILSCSGKYMAGNLTIGSKTLSCKGKMMSSDITVTFDNPQDIFYLFDSSKSDNFIFGEYRFKPFSGTVNSVAQTSWPPTNDSDGLNTSSSKIVLRGDGSGMLQPTGASPAYLLLQPNSFGTSVSGLFTNNISIVYNGQTYNARTVGLPTGNCTINVNAYCTGSGSATITYKGTGASVTVSGKTSKTYSIDTRIVYDGDILFEAKKNCGDFVITDIWFEYKE